MGNAPGLVQGAEAGVGIGLQDRGEAGEVLARMDPLAVWRVGEPHRRRGVTTGRAFVAHVARQPAGGGLAGARRQHRQRRVVAVQHWRGQHVAAPGGVLATDALQLGGTLGTALSWVTTAYMVYTIAVILVKLLWECEQDEFELGAKQELQSCHYVGSYCASDVLGVCIERRKSYCCFTTPLARILNEQVRPQLGRSWGSAKNPDCAGLAVDELARIDWSGVNLDEWLAILAATGHYPTLDTLNLANLIGAGSEYNVTGTRADAAERSSLRADGLDQGQIRQDAGQELWGITLPVLP